MVSPQESIFLTLMDAQMNNKIGGFFGLSNGLPTQRSRLIGYSERNSLRFSAHSHLKKEKKSIHFPHSHFKQNRMTQKQK